MLRTFVAIALLAATTAAPLAAPPPLTPLQLYQRSCGNVLNSLPHVVRRETIAAVGKNAQISVHEVCRGVSLNDFGNAAGLVKPIAANRALRLALAEWGFRPDDVVGIVINGNRVQLYAHHG